MFVRQPHQPGKIKGRAVLRAHRTPQRGGVVWIGEDLDLPGVTGQTNPSLRFIRQGVGERLAAGNITELLLGGEIWFERVDGFG